MEGSWTIDSRYISKWLLCQDDDTYALILEYFELLRRKGPALGRPAVDRVSRSRFNNMKELRPASTGASGIRILFAFDPDRSAIMLLAGDKRGTWNRWYKKNIPLADARFELHLKRRLGE